MAKSKTAKRVKKVARSAAVNRRITASRTYKQTYAAGQRRAALYALGRAARKR